MITARYFDVRRGELVELPLPAVVPVLLVPDADVHATDERHPRLRHREFYLGHSPLAAKGVFDYYAGRRGAR